MSYWVFAFIFLILSSNIFADEPDRSNTEARVLQIPCKECPSESDGPAHAAEKLNLDLQFILQPPTVAESAVQIKYGKPGKSNSFEIAPNSISDGVRNATRVPLGKNGSVGLKGKKIELKTPF